MQNRNMARELTAEIWVVAARTNTEKESYAKFRETQKATSKQGSTIVHECKGGHCEPDGTDDAELS